MNGKKLKEVGLSGIIANNPVFIMVLGMCPTLAMSTSLKNAFAMGVATAFVLICSNVFISLLRKIIPEKIRIPCYIIIISTFVIIVEMVMKRYMPGMFSTMGVFLSLIVVNCIIMARAESFALSNSVGYSALDGLSMGTGFTLSICVIGFIRELLASGSVFGFKLFSSFPVMDSGAAANAFGFITLACVMAAFKYLVKKYNDNKADRELDGILSKEEQR